jgi:hypothetical protein
MFSFCERRAYANMKCNSSKHILSIDKLLYTAKGENYMRKILGVLVNLGVLAYLGFKTASCMGLEQVTGLNTAQNPFILSFVGVVSLFIVLRY